jgi:hypothetical protein
MNDYQDWKDNQDENWRPPPEESNTLLREAITQTIYSIFDDYSKLDPFEQETIDKLVALFQAEKNKLLAELLEHETTVTRSEFTSLRMAEVKTHAFEAVPTSVIKGYMK